MALRYSTGLRNKLLNDTGIRSALANGVIRIYSGAQPVNANAAVTGTLLLTITKSSGAFTHGSATNGINFDAPVDAVLSKAAAEVWSGVGVAGGTMGWFRFSGNPLDDGSSSTTLARIDGSIAKVGGDLEVNSTTVVTGQPNTVDQFDLSMDPQ